MSAEWTITGLTYDREKAEMKPSISGRARETMTLIA